MQYSKKKDESSKPEAKYNWLTGILINADTFKI